MGIRERHPGMGAMPKGPASAGTIVQGVPRIGIWLMPNNKTAGELEDFVAALIPGDDPVWPRSQAYIDEIPKKDRERTGKLSGPSSMRGWPQGSLQVLWDAQ